MTLPRLQGRVSRVHEPGFARIPWPRHDRDAGASHRLPAADRAEILASKDRSDGCVMDIRCSAHELKCLLKRALLEGGPRAEPGTIQPVFLASCAALMVDELRHSVHQAPGGSLR